MFEIRHLAGILMLRDQEMVSFQVDDTWVDFEIITPAEDLEWKPFDFWNGYSRLGIQEFLKDRLPPRGMGLYSLLKMQGFLWMQMPIYILAAAVLLMMTAG